MLFDRDGTLIIDVPYNGEPEAVSPLPGARAALDRLRAHEVAMRDSGLPGSCSTGTSC